MSAIILSRRRTNKFGSVSYGARNKRGTVLITPGFFNDRPPKEIRLFADGVIEPIEPRKWTRRKVAVNSGGGR
jgi:hypothetical protein